MEMVCLMEICVAADLDMLVDVGQMAMLSIILCQRTVDDGSYGGLREFDCGVTGDSDTVTFACSQTSLCIRRIDLAQFIILLYEMMLSFHGNDVLSMLILEYDILFNKKIY